MASIEGARGAKAHPQPESLLPRNVPGCENPEQGFVCGVAVWERVGATGSAPQESGRRRTLPVSTTTRFWLRKLEVEKMRHKGLCENHPPAISNLVPLLS